MRRRFIADSWSPSSGHPEEAALTGQQAAHLARVLRAFRERNPHVNPPPTAAARAQNTRIMTILFRIVGVFFLFFSALSVLGGAR